MKCYKCGAEVKEGLHHCPFGNPVRYGKNPAAVALGKIKTPKKAKASRKNGKLGGRPTRKCEMCLEKGSVKTTRFGLIPCPRCHPAKAARAIMKKSSETEMLDFILDKGMR
jgi:hypothetical protein